MVNAHPNAALPHGSESVDLSGITLALLGDLKHGRTVHSLAKLASQLERPPKLTLVSPPSLGMPEYVTEALTARSLLHPSDAAVAPS